MSRSKERVRPAVRKRPHGLFFILGAIGACSSPEPPATSSTRDSAGVRIVESAAPAWDGVSGWRVGEAITTIGEFEGEEEYQLFRASGGMVNVAGEIVVANTGSHEVRVYDRAGNHLRSSGGEGEGPGEYTGFLRLFRFPGDSILVWDSRQARGTILSPEGAFHRIFRLQGGTFARFVGLLSDGSFVTSPSNTFGSGEVVQGYQRMEQSFIHVGADGDSLDAIGPFSGTEYFLKSFGSGSFTVATQLLGKVFASDLANDLLYVGSGDDYTISVIGIDGTVEQLIRRRFDPVSVSRSMFDDVVADMLDQTDERFRSNQRELYEDMSPPDFLPAYSSVTHDTHGNLWVLNYSLPDTGNPTYSVFDPGGVWLGDVTLPEGVTVLDIGDDYLLGWFTDELEVEHIALYELLKN